MATMTKMRKTMTTKLNSPVLLGRLARWLGLVAVFVLCVAPMVFGDGGRSGDPRLAGNRWGAQYFPNVELKTHEGETVRFFDDLIRDKVVVINFIYTECPDACPMETARLTEVYEILGDRVGKDVFFYSISIDPETDTPEVLAEYAERFQTGPGWLFLTGVSEEIELLRRRLGLYIDEVNKDPTDHNLSMIIGNQKSGRWMKRSPFENPYILANEIGSSLHNFKVENTSQNLNDYAGNVPQLRNLTQGESLFRTRCSVCHNIGQGDGLRRTGPNLLEVTERREDEWLRRWIAEPDVMIQEEDPTALALLIAYKNVPMPNMQLNDHEISSVIEYLAAESRRVSKIESVEELLSRQDAEIPSCCEKNENVVLDESEDTAVNQEDEGTVAVVDLDSRAEEENNSTVAKSTPMSMPLILGCAFGTVGVLLRRRKL
ncbi:MAG: c-type cytochrome [Planctomycetes bacterium]|jgi:protein SCO1/2|nr:c-type cytochrome [Planctomycetota bacterium]